MRFQDKLKTNTREQLYNEYCGFLDMSITDYMYIQNRLMEEQIKVWSASGLGRKLLGDKSVQTVDEFRRTFPLTRYEDYADTLLARRGDMLPAEPIVWIETTWEGGLRPIKVAPYTRAMLDTCRHNTVTIMMFASGDRRGHFEIKKGTRILYGGAPLPYATGLLPSLLNEDVDIEWLPDSGSELSFSQRIKKGFALAHRGGADYFFAVGSVASYITDSFSSSASGKSGGSHKLDMSITTLLRYIRAKYVSRRDQRPILPKDIFRLKGFVVAGTDSRCYRERLSAAWGITPIEIAAGTESTWIAAENRDYAGMFFFPDACFYEFIPESEMRANLADPSYTPRTVLTDEVSAGETYELVLSVLHGGAFMRYRIGDMYRCLSGCADGALPRFTFVDRVPDIIDIAGFTRITEHSIDEVLHLSKLGIGDWVAKKEFDAGGNPFLHMYVELNPSAQQSDVLCRQVITEQLSVYFRYFDSDYSDLKKLLNMEPLTITILKYGALAAYETSLGRKLARINPSAIDISDLLKFQARYRYETEGGSEK